MARVGVVSFPGSNCERETLRAFASVPGVSTMPLWHKDTTLPAEGLDLIVLPGGFSYGDYLRAGAIARFAALMPAIIEFAHAGGYVLGICNGFQILTEAGLLPGALARNRNLRFISRTVPLRVERADTPWTCRARKGQILHIPVAHADGRYTHHADDFARLDEGGQVLLRYADEGGRVDDDTNINGSQGSAAGVMCVQGNVFGLMPHPERVADEWAPGRDGRILIESIVEWIRMHGGTA